MAEPAKRGRGRPKKTEAEKPPAKGHNSDSYSIASEELRQFIERIERLDAEAKDIADQKKEVFAEAKGRGYDTKVMRKVLALRKRDKDDVAEEEAILEMYLAALGMDFTPSIPAGYGDDEDDGDEMV